MVSVNSSSFVSIHTLELVARAIEAEDNLSVASAVNRVFEADAEYPLSLAIYSVVLHAGSCGPWTLLYWYTTRCAVAILLACKNLWL